MAASRAAGSGSSQGRSRNVKEMRLPVPPASVLVRTSAGTITFSDCGVSPRRSAKRRSPPAQAASTTSLGLTPKRRRIARRSPSERVTRTWWRRGEPGRFSGELGAGGSRVCASVRAPRLARPGSRRGALARRTGVSASAAPSAARSTTARASRSPAEGDGAGAHASPPRPPRHRRLGVEQRVAELDHGGPVDHAVVRLADDRDAPAGQRVRDPHLPQRAVAPQRRREDRSRRSRSGRSPSAGRRWLAGS